MKIECWFDGSTEPINPGGHTSYGALVKENGYRKWSKSGYVGFGPGMTNNVGEYAGVITILEYLLENGITEGIIYGDSKLVVKQLNGQWKAKKGCYVPYYRTAINLRRKLPKVRIRWISRDFNVEADYLSRQAIKTVPHAKSSANELTELVKQQRIDAKRDGIRIIKSRV